MTGQLPGADAPARDARCRACSAAIASGALRCDKCGAMQKDVTCPHCGAMAGASPHVELRWVCDVCGAPRIPVLDPSIKSTGREIAPLKRAETARRGRSAARAMLVGSSLLLSVATLLFASVSIAFGAHLVVALTSILVTLSLTSLVVWSALRARARGREIEPALDAAWVAIATDVAQQLKRPITSRELAAKLQIEESLAEQLLALLDVNDIVKGELTEQGDLAFGSKLRVDAPPPTEPIPDLAAEQAAAEEATAESLPTAKTMVADPQLKR